MTEAVFPVLGAAFVMLVVLPASALVSKAALALLEGDRAGGPLHGLSLRYLILTGSSVLPVGWLVSAGMHQAESGRSVACLLHDAAALCFEPGLFALTLALVVIACCAHRLRVTRKSAPSRSLGSPALRSRLSRIVATHAGLRSIVGRVDVTDDPKFALATEGLLRPRIVIGAAYAARLTDDALAAALGHETEHVRSFDPLLYTVLDLALAMNPFGRWLLAPHAARWVGAREAHCDREAVIGGAPPLALAEAIVSAARASWRESLVALGARDTSMLKLRINLLCAFAEKHPSQCCRSSPVLFPTAVLVVWLVLLAPHQSGAASLDALHSGAEQALSFLWR